MLNALLVHDSPFKSFYSGKSLDSKFSFCTACSIFKIRRFFAALPVGKNPVLHAKWLDLGRAVCISGLPPGTKYSDSSIKVRFSSFRMLEYEPMFPEIFFDVQPASVLEYIA
jgi:hypothetical protein